MAQTILIIEDDEAVRSTFSDILSEEHYEVIQAEDGVEALEYLHHHPKPDLILMDLTLPRMTPEQFVHDLKENKETAEIPFIVVSGKDTIREEAENIHALAYLQKPFDLDKFLRVIRDSLIA